MTINEQIVSILEEASREGRSTPSLRAIRAKIGHGSLTTISEVVKEWRVRQMVDAGELPPGFDAEEVNMIGSAVWQTVTPILQQRIEAVRRSAQERIDLEVAEAQKLMQSAQEMLAEAEALREEMVNQRATQDKELNEMRSSLDRSVGALDEARKEVESLRTQARALQHERDEALKAAAAAEASADAVRRLVPFLDPKHLAGTKAKR